MTASIAERVVAPGDSARCDDAWSLKERIRREEGVLKQNRALFERFYRRSTVYLRTDSEGDLTGMAAARTDAGYLLLLAVSPEHRRSGIGRSLVERVAADSPRVVCHVRTDNDPAIGFYEDLGFTVERLVSGYYRDGEDAYYLILDEDRPARDGIGDGSGEDRATDGGAG